MAKSKNADSQAAPLRRSSRTSRTTPVAEPQQTAKTSKPEKPAASKRASKAVKRKAESDDQPGSATKDESAAAPAKKAKSAKTAPGKERDENERYFWLMKAEPESRIENGVDVKFSIDDLSARDEPEAWDGVRNAVAQKNMRNMRKDELSFFYHSNCKVPGIAGVMKIVREQSTDESAFDPKHPYYDPKSKQDSPRWIVVHVEFVKKFDELIPLKTLQEHAKDSGPLQNLQTLKQSRLSVSQVGADEWEFILGLANVEQKELDEPATKGS